MFSVGETLSQYFNPDKGIFIGKAVVAEVEVEYNAKGRPTWKTTSDVGLRIHLDHGKDWLKELWLGVDFVRDDEGTPVGFRSFVLDRLFREFGVKFTLTEDYKIPEDVVKSLIGQKVFYLDYAAWLNKKTGKVATNTYNVLICPKPNESDEEAGERLWSIFQGDSWAVNKWSPDLYETVREANKTKQEDPVEASVDDDKPPF